MPNNGEVWKSIEGMLNYEISTFGQVRNVKTGKILAQSQNGNGYLKINFRIEGKLIKRYVHRLVAVAFVANPRRHLLVDHQDRDKTNNHADNLRWVNKSQNGANAGKTTRSTHSKYKGVSFNIRSLKWIARININGTCYALGTYQSEEDAALAYNEGALRLVGECAGLNDVD